MLRSLSAAVVTALVLGCVGCGGDGSGDGDATAAPSSTGAGSTSTGTTDPTTAAPPQSSVSKVAETGRPTPADVPTEVAREASAAATDFADVVADALSAPDAAVSGAVAGAVTGAARDALVAQAEEYRRSGWRIEGRLRVLSVEVYEHEADRMLVGACIDDSDVTVVDRKGTVVSGGADRRPTLNLLTLNAEGERWVIVESSFPSDPDC